MADDKIRVSWDEINTPQVDAKIKHNVALAQAQEHFQQQAAQNPARRPMAMTSPVMPPAPVQRRASGTPLCSTWRFSGLSAVWWPGCPEKLLNSQFQTNLNSSVRYAVKVQAIVGSVNRGRDDPGPR